MVSNGCGRLRDRLRLLFLYCVAFPRTTRGILSWNLHWAILSYRRAGAGYCCYRPVRSMNRGERCDRPSWDRNCRMLPTTIVWQRRQYVEVVHGSGGGSRIWYAVYCQSIIKWHCICCVHDRTLWGFRARLLSTPKLECAPLRLRNFRNIYIMFSFPYII